MRMLFVLICSLLFSETSAVDPGKIIPTGCGEIYDCFVPSKCKGTEPKIEESIITIVKKNNQIFDNCEAILRFHLYADHSAFVSIESLNAATTSIEFYDYIDANNIGTKVKFACKMLEVSGKWELQGYYGPHTNRIKNDPVISDTKPEKIKCEFNVQIAKKEKMFFETDDYQIKIDDKVTIKERILTPLAKCDPSTFIDGHNSDKKNNMVYKKANYKLGKFSCDDAIYTQESRLEPSPDFKLVQIAECDFGGKKGTISLQFRGEQQPTQYSLMKKDFEIRCAAEVKYFCKEGVRSKPDKTALVHVPPNLSASPKTGSTLKCPAEAPHFVFREDEKPIRNPRFECLSYEEVQRWTVIGATNMVLDPEEAYYCTKDLECHLHLRIAENSVINGDLDAKTFLPKCSVNGILHARQGEKEKVEILPPSCNYATGEFEYKVKKDGRTEVVVETTIFECTYPQEVDQYMNSLSPGSTVGLSVAGMVIAGVCCGALIGFLLWGAAKKQKAAAAKQKQRELDELKHNQLVWKKYCMDKAERDALAAEEKRKKKEREKNGDMQEKTPKPVVSEDVTNWNRMLMSFQRKSMECTGTIKDRELTKKPRTEQGRIKKDKKDLDEMDTDESFVNYNIMHNEGTAVEDPTLRTPAWSAYDKLTVAYDQDKNQVDELECDNDEETEIRNRKEEPEPGYKKDLTANMCKMYCPKGTRYCA